MNDEFYYKITQSGDIPIVHLHGSFDMYHKDDIQFELDNRLKTKKIKYLVFNMQSLEYIDSAALGVLVSVLKKIKQLNGKIYLTYVSDFISDVLRRVHLEKYFSIMKSDLNAVSDIRKQGG